MAQPPVETRIAFADIDVVHEIKELWALAQTWPVALYRAHVESVTSVSSNQWLRLVAIVGGYVLLRPYIVKMFAKTQSLQVESEHEGAAAKISANALRGREAAPVVESESEDESKASGADWGKKARKRQRQAEKKIAEAQEKARLQEEEDEEDRKLEEFLLRNANYEGNPNPHNLTLDD